MGGLYGIPHGLANAVVLPYVLEYYGKSAHKRLAELADVVGISLPTDTNGQKATRFINAIKELNRAMNIPEKINGVDSKDIPLMAERTWKEANPLYPVPRILSKRDLENLFQMVNF